MFGVEDMKEPERVDETMGDIETDFKQPIRLASHKRAIPAGDQRRLKSTADKSFIVKDMEIPGSAGLFAEQNGKDMTAAINRNGLLRLKFEPENEDESNFLKLPQQDREKFVDILRNFQKYLDDPKDDFELNTASKFESYPKDARL
jgi:hypothetical protein